MAELKQVEKQAKVKKVTPVEERSMHFVLPDALVAEMRAVANNKGIPLATVREAIETAYDSAFKKVHGDAVNVVTKIVAMHLFGEVK